MASIRRRIFVSINSVDTDFRPIGRFGKLTVSTEPSSVEESVAAQMKVYYDRSNGAVRVESAQLVEAAVYNMSGTLVMKQLVEGSGVIDMSAYPAGVYIVRCGGYSTKIVK